MARGPVETIDIDTTDSFLDGPDIKYADGEKLVDKLADKPLGTPSPGAPKLPRIDH